MTILDSNVLSALMQSTPETAVVAWLDRQARTSVWITSVTILEIQYGLQIMALGKRLTRLAQEFENLLNILGHRVAPFDDAAARLSAQLMAERHKKGRSIDLRDTMIAGIALAHHASLATRNIAYFSDTSLSLINPWTA